MSVSEAKMSEKAMIQIRTYSDDDFTEVCNLLIRNMNHDLLTEPLIHEKLYDDPDWNPESVFIAEVNGSPAGFMMGVKRKVRGGGVNADAVRTQYANAVLPGQLDNFLLLSFRDSQTGRGDDNAFDAFVDAVPDSRRHGVWGQEDVNQINRVRDIVDFWIGF